MAQAYQTGQFIEPVSSKALWTWDTTNPDNPSIIGYAPGGPNQPTKTGLMPSDLQNFIGTPLQYFGNNQKSPVPPTALIQWIRWAEDNIEQQTNILLTQTYVASPPCADVGQASSIGVIPQNNNNVQVQGIDYDLDDAAYDFHFENAKDEGWMYMFYRYSPIRHVELISFIYPLMNEYFRVPPSWIQTDKQHGLVRLVPSTNIMNLPLFSIQLAFMGFAQSIPAGLWTQYICGLSPYDYQTRFSFMKQLVLCEAAIQTLTSIQAGVNMGMTTSTIHSDSLSYTTQYPGAGPFDGYIKSFRKQRDDLMKIAYNAVRGPVFQVI